MAEQFPKWMKGISLETGEVLETTNKIHIKKMSFKHIRVILLKTKDKEKILTPTRGKIYLPSKEKYYKF